ncbi:unnamed protein product [Schistocephalus solidus]|uniref:Uncharacterized protein n=1 Tax=Schistocephalus solidus TaxID=70667 RepID=A0A3P7EMA2_SCHSO|nr:unnamed protein product [Schistocephalus solidus]
MTPFFTGSLFAFVSFSSSVLELITDEQCDIERDAVPLLSLLSTCLLLSEDPIFPQVSSMVGARLKAAKRPWMIVSSDACNEAAWPAYAKSQKISKLLVEELLCLGAVLILGRSQTDQRVAALEASEEAAVFELSHVLLKAICGLLCATLSRRSFCAAALLLLNSATPGGETKCQSPWPEGTSEAGRVFYTQLITALYSYLTDITLRDLRLLTMALLGKALRIVRHQLPLSEVTKLEGTVWNLVVTESLQLEDYDEDQLPCPPALIVFLAEVGALRPYALFGCFLAYLQLSTGPCTFLRDQEKRGLLQKVSASGFNLHSETALFTRSRYRFFLLPLLDLSSLRGTVS